MEKKANDVKVKVSDAHIPRWYVIKTTYGREQKANGYLVEHNIRTFCPLMTVRKMIRGKRRFVTEGRLPNLFFAYGTEVELTPLVQQNPEMPYLRFYCRYSKDPRQPYRRLITVPQSQMDFLMRVCAAEGQDVLLCPEAIRKFEKGTLVRVIEGPFQGVIGRVSRFRGQQRVGLIIGDILTAVTAYVPNAYLEEVSPEEIPPEMT